MTIIAWIILGLVAGFIGTRSSTSLETALFSTSVSVVGAVVGGWLFHTFGAAVSGLNLYGCSSPWVPW
jgi:uncharacterized membrane protein YeaQ/YmgE (transglycosylase-associated protein family)